MEFEVKELSAPLMAHLELTYLCNHRCVHCYRLDDDVNNRPVEDVKDNIIIENAKALIKGGILQLILTGGEPLIKKELVKRIISLANDNQVIVSLNTNLTLADDDIIDFLSKTNTRILVSCPSAMQDSYESITLTKNYSFFETSLSKVIAANVKTAVNMVVTKDNLGEVRQTAKRMKELGCTAFCVTPVALNMDYPKPELLLSKVDINILVDDILWIEKELNIKVDILDGLPKCIFSPKILSAEHLFLYRRCQAGRTFIAVSPNGDVRPCANSSISYGNLHQSSLADIWKAMSYWRSEKIIPNQCRDCLWLNRCLGGCRTNAKALTGEWNGTDIWSPSHILTSPPNHAKKIDLQDDTMLVVANGIQIRQEYDGIFLISCTRNRTFCMVNQSILDFVKEIQYRGVVYWRQIYAELAANAPIQKVTDIITKLIQYKVLKILTT